MGWTASDFERLDPRLFRSFLALVRTQSFSAAAVAASLTQGAVSQQIAKLEERLNTRLFMRTGHRVITTPAGQMLADYAQAYMDHASRFLEQLNEEFESLRGQVSYAMPESCIHAPHFGWLLERRKTFPDISLSIRLTRATEVMRLLLDGDIDFGFVNQEVGHAAVHAYPFCFEEYVLVQSGQDTPVAWPATLDEFLALPMIVYPGMVEVLMKWLSVQYGEADPISPVALRTMGEFNDIRGALAMVGGGLGVSVFPSHVAAPMLEQGSARLVRPDAPKVTQQISIVRLKDRRMPARVKRVIGWFLHMHTELQPVPEEFVE
jgi:DNA-binding transcriptional LysR family regulator